MLTILINIKLIDLEEVVIFDAISQPPGQRVEDKINWYIDFLSQYGYKSIKE